MKKMMLVLTLALTVCASVQAAGYPPGEGSGAVTNQLVNPLDVARAFALKTPAYYQGTLYCDMLISNQFQWTMMSFVMMAGDFAITNLVINGTNNIPLPEPIYSLPMGDGGLMQNVYLYVNAMTKIGEYAGNGYAQRSAVVKGDSLVVTIIPAAIRQEIPVDVAQYSNDIQVVIDDFTYGYGWGMENGKLYVYLPPVGGTWSYTLRQWSTGAVIGSGTIEAFHTATQADDAYLGISYLGNVVGAEFPQPNGQDSWVGVPNINFNCSVPTTNGTNVMGKVVFLDVGSGALELMLGGQHWVYVQSATADGDMPFVELVDQSSYYETRVYTKTMNVGKVVITIIPKVNPGYSPWMNLHRFYGASPGGGGGGKG